MKDKYSKIELKVEEVCQEALKNIRIIIDADNTIESIKLCLNRYKKDDRFKMEIDDSLFVKPKRLEELLKVFDKTNVAIEDVQIKFYSNKDATNVKKLKVFEDTFKFFKGLSKEQLETLKKECKKD